MPLVTATDFALKCVAPLTFNYHCAFIDDVKIMMNLSVCRILPPSSPLIDGSYVVSSDDKTPPARVREEKIRVLY